MYSFHIENFLDFDSCSNCLDEIDQSDKNILSISNNSNEFFKNINTSFSHIFTIEKYDDITYLHVSENKNIISAKCFDLSCKNNGDKHSFIFLLFEESNKIFLHITHDKTNSQALYLLNSKYLPVVYIVHNKRNDNYIGNFSFYNPDIDHYSNGYQYALTEQSIQGIQGIQIYINKNKTIKINEYCFVKNYNNIDKCSKTLINIYNIFLSNLENVYLTVFYNNFPTKWEKKGSYDIGCGGLLYWNIGYYKMECVYSLLYNNEKFMIEIIPHNDNDIVPFNYKFIKNDIFYIYLTDNIPDDILPFVLKDYPLTPEFENILNNFEIRLILLKDEYNSPMSWTTTEINDI